MASALQNVKKSLGMNVNFLRLGHIKAFSARNRSVLIAAWIAVNAAIRLQNPATEPGFLFLFTSPAIERGFFVFGPTPVSLPKADANDVEADLFEDSR